MGKHLGNDIQCADGFCWCQHGCSTAKLILKDPRPPKAEVLRGLVVNAVYNLLVRFLTVALRCDTLLWLLISSCHSGDSAQ